MLEGPYGLVFVALGATLGGLLLVAFALAAVYVLVSFSHWIVDRRLRGVEPGLPSREHLDALTATFTGELISAGTFFALHPFGSIDPPLPPEKLVRQGRPLLLVHGFMQARSNFVLLGPRLAGWGLGPIFTVNLRTMDGDLEHHARVLSERIDQIRRATGARQIDCVAHSMGGLVARLAEAGRKEPRIRRLVTLGTPHHGTQVALVALGPAARDMRPGSEVIRGLPPPPPGQLVSISSTHDFMVIPPESARVAPEGRDVVVRHVGHLALLTDHEVSLEVVRALGEDILLRRTSDLFEPVEAREPELAASP
ncbi:MAG: alpha/beta fold hydrolase [Myxococcota bacterium]